MRFRLRRALDYVANDTLNGNDNPNAVVQLKKESVIILRDIFKWSVPQAQDVGCSQVHDKKMKKHEN